MNHGTDTIPVIYRIWVTGNREVIALFPTLPGGNKPSEMSSYMHFGQHGAAERDAVYRVTRPASVTEAADLARELAGIGYQLEPVKRITWRHDQARMAALLN